MPSSVDIRGIATKLLKSHHLRYIDMRSVSDPQTGLKTIVLKFRKDKDHSPKAFFDDLNENGIQYKKLSKDPNATEIVCELWPKGQKRRATELREKVRQKSRSQQNKGPLGTPSQNLSYVGIPSPGTQPIMISSLAKELREAGLQEEAEDLLRIAGEQDWDEFRRIARKVFIRLKIHQRPEIRQLKENIAGELLRELGPDSFLLKNLKGSDLEKRINECLYENIDLVLDTRGIANSMLTRVASPSHLLTSLKSIKRGIRSLVSRAESAGHNKVASMAKNYEAEVDLAINASIRDENFSEFSYTPFFRLVEERDLDSAYLHLLDLTL